MFSIEFPRPDILDMNLYSFFVKKCLLHFVDSIILQLCLLPDRISCDALRCVWCVKVRTLYTNKGPDVTKLYSRYMYSNYCKKAAKKGFEQ